MRWSRVDCSCCADDDDDDVPLMTSHDEPLSQQPTTGGASSEPADTEWRNCHSQRTNHRPFTHVFHDKNYTTATADKRPAKQPQFDHCRPIYLSVHPSVTYLLWLTVKHVTFCYRNGPYNAKSPSKCMTTSAYWSDSRSRMRNNANTTNALPYDCNAGRVTQFSCHTASMCRRASGVRVVTSSLTLTASRASFRRVTRNVAKRDAIPTQPPPPPPPLPLLLLVLPRSSNEPEPEILAYDDWRRGDRYVKLSRHTVTAVNEILWKCEHENSYQECKNTLQRPSCLSW